ncbi:MAG: hypothetical protein H6553_11985 [Chitinophagales bacterium]|nr:hypothetical protein [Chitinophagales bacterium]
MKNFLRNLLAIIIGVVVGSLVNLLIIVIGKTIIQPPEGVDVTNLASLQENIDLLENKHFIFPLLAHALGTLVGALIAVFISASSRMYVCLIVGIVFLVGGFISLANIPAPLWFTYSDIFGAYIPMAFIAYAIFNSRNTTTQVA